MPKVGKGPNAKHFSYSPAGRKAAEDFAKKSGQKVVMAPPKKKGK